MTGCGGFRADQDFSYNQETGFVVHDDSGLCVAGPDSRFGSGVTLENCNASLDRQMVWNRQSSPRQTVADILDGDANLKSFTDALRGSGLFARTEDENSQTTVYAPTNEAFNALEPATLQVLFSDPMLLQETLLFHQTDGTRFTDDVTKRCLPNVGCTGESTLSGSRMPILQEIECDRSGFFICYNRAMFTYFGAEKALLDTAHRDLAATNGVVHYINKLLVPDSVKAKVEAAIQTKSIS
jgi:transforming growth factor-beta-induced protein